MTLLELLEQGWINTAENFCYKDSRRGHTELLVLRHSDGEFLFYDPDKDKIIVTFRIEEVYNNA